MPDINRDEEALPLISEADRELKALQTAGLRRSLKTLDEVSGASMVIQGRTMVNFSSNDYLGLNSSEELKQAMVEAVGKYGVGSGASRLVCGNWLPHEELEDQIAQFKSAQAALAFSSGHATSIGTLPALCGADDAIILDKLCHASLIDGAKLSGATLRVFPHNNLDKLERILSGIRIKNSRCRILIVTESIYSMDGDAAPLSDLVALKEKYGAWLMVDEAHAVGVLGPQGRGLIAELGLEKRVELQMGTLSKAAGVSGGYIAAARPVIDLLINRARSLVYSTAPPPAIAATATASLKLIMSDEGDARRARLNRNKEAFYLKLDRYEPTRVMPAAIFPFIIGDATAAVQAAESLQELGYFIPAIRFPTVARGSSRLRITLSALHELVEIEGLVSRLNALML